MSHLATVEEWNDLLTMLAISPGEERGQGWRRSGDPVMSFNIHI